MPFFLLPVLNGYACVHTTQGPHACAHAHGVHTGCTWGVWSHREAPVSVPPLPCPSWCPGPPLLLGEGVGGVWACRVAGTALTAGVTALCLQGPSQLPPGFVPPQDRFPELTRQEAVCRHQCRRRELSLKGWLYLKLISLLRPEIQLKATGTFSTASNSNRVGRLPRAEWGPRPSVPGNERRWCCC